MFGVKTANTYENLTNIYFVISPADPEKAARPGLLLNAHYDSTFGAPGAADCASCVGVLLEAARAILHDPNFPVEVPLAMLWNGGEEAFVTVSGSRLQGQWMLEVLARGPR